MSLVVSLCHTLSAYGISTASAGTLGTPTPILTVTRTPPNPNPNSNPNPTLNVMGPRNGPYEPVSLFLRLGRVVRPWQYLLEVTNTVTEFDPWNGHVTNSLLTPTLTPPTITISMLHTLPSSCNPDVDRLPPPSETLPYAQHPIMSPLIKTEHLTPAVSNNYTSFAQGPES